MTILVHSANSGVEETVLHLFCSLIVPSVKVAGSLAIGVNWNLQLQPLDMVLDARNAFGNRIFREIFITGCWIIWTTRNKVIFDNGSTQISTWSRPRCASRPKRPLVILGVFENLHLMYFCSFFWA